jgi:type I restriction enzyme S subunit
MIGCRGSCGQINVADGKSWINGNAMSIDKLDPAVDLRYLYHFLSQYNFSKIISGTSQPQITYAGLTKVQVPILSLPTQRKIADCLDCILWLIKTSDEQIVRLNHLVKSRFVEVA